MLGRLNDEDEERIELRLLSDAHFAEEFDIIVDQVADEFAAKSLTAAELEEIQRYFLKATQRRDKATFANALLNFQERSALTTKIAVNRPSFVAQIRDFWNRQSISLQIASAVCALLVVCMAAVFFQWRSTPKNIVALTLSSSNLTRGEGGQIERVRLPADVGTLRVSLRLPERLSGTSAYRIEVLDSSGKVRSIQPSEHDDQVVTMSLEASDLEPGQYALRLFATDAAGSEQRIGGTYSFIVER